MNIYYILLPLLGHLLADFIFQPKSLMRWKYKSTYGVLAHTGVHLFFYLLFFWQYCWTMGIGIALFFLAVSHFLIDFCKVHYELKKTGGYIRSFLVDQAAHLMCIFGVAYIIENWNLVGRDMFGITHCQTGLIGGNSSFLFLGLCIFIIGSHVVEIAKFQLIRGKNPQATFKPNFQAMLMRGAILMMLVLGFLGWMVTSQS